MIVPRHYEDLGVLHENTLPPRAYYVPASAAADPSPWKREESDRLQLLSGQWSMRYLPSIHDLTEPFWEGGEPVRAPEDGEDAGAAVAGQYGGQQDRGGGFACTALAIDDCDGSWSWPVLADREHVCAFRAFCASWPDSESEASQAASPALSGRLLRGLLIKE